MSHAQKTKLRSSLCHPNLLKARFLFPSRHFLTSTPIRHSDPLASAPRNSPTSRRDGPRARVSFGSRGRRAESVTSAKAARGRSINPGRGKTAE